MKFIDNTDKVLKAIDKSIVNSLNEIGITATTNSQAHTPVDTGQLRRSLTHKTDKDNYSVKIGTNITYGLPVHEGTARMAGRPYLQEGINETVNEIVPILKKNFKQNLR